MAIPDWTREPDWDQLYLGGMRVPGVARVQVKLPSGLDIQKPKGGKRATIRDDGDPPAQLDIEIELQPHEMAEFEGLIPFFRARSKNGRAPLEIAHPNAALWGIGVITIGEIDSPMPRSGGTKLISMKAHEWAPAPVAVKKAPDKPKVDEMASWVPYTDDGVAGSGFHPSEDPAENL